MVPDKDMEGNFKHVPKLFLALSILTLWGLFKNMLSSAKI